MKKLIILAIMTILCFTACAKAEKQTTNTVVSSEAIELFEQKNPYIGDASANGRLLEVLDIAKELGTYTIELRTNEEPYWIKLQFEICDMEPDKFKAIVNEKAYFLLALIENADVVQYSYPEVENGKKILAEGYMTKEQATENLGKNIKSFGESAEKVQELINELSTIK